MRMRVENNLARIRSKKYLLKTKQISPARTVETIIKLPLILKASNFD